MNVHLLPVLSDNYIPVVRGPDRGLLVVDPAVAEPVLHFARASGCRVGAILLTHHHGDHIGGVAEIVAAFPTCEVYGNADDASRLPPLTRPVRGGERVEFGDFVFNVVDAPGHTSGHIMYFNDRDLVGFVGDVLFGFGCGRVFEGTYAEMFRSISIFKTLSAGYRIYCAHEYTQTNARFAQSMLPDDQLIARRAERVRRIRDGGLPTVPLSLNEEMETNPFLRARDIAEFTRFRDARNSFR